MKKVLILGKGKIGKGIEFYLRKQKPSLRVDFFSKESKIRKSHLLISALPGEAGEMGLKLALKFKKDLIDVSDLGYHFYLKHKQQIEKRGIQVFPECGFSPGLTNLICGYENSLHKIKKIEIIAGTLSKTKFFFPFLWCFEDLIEGHKIKAGFVKDGKKIYLPPFFGYKKERIFGIEAESYLLDSLSSLPRTLKVKNISYRVLRPFGFFYFFQFMKTHGFFKKQNFIFTKRILEKEKRNNLTLAEIKVLTSKKKILWKIKSFSKAQEDLNSMQKITCLLPAIVARFILEQKIGEKGLCFAEELGRDQKLFKEILRETKKEKILMMRKRAIKRKITN